MELLEISKISDNLWEKYFNFNVKLFDKFYPDSKMNSTDWKAFKQNSLVRIKTYEEGSLDEFIMYNDDEVTGWFDRSVWGNNINFGFDVIYENITTEIFIMIFGNIYQFMNDTNKTEAFWGSFDKRKLKAIIETGAEKAEDKLVSRLPKNKIDIQLCKKCVEETETKYDYKTVLYKKMPEELYDEYTKLVLPILDDIKSINPQLNKEDINITPELALDMLAYPEVNDMLNYIYILYSGNNEMIGVTSVIMNKNNPEIIRYNGGLTGIKREFRGNGLGKYLKSKMFLLLYEDFSAFKFIQTDTMPWNKYMYSINTELGFRPHKEGALFRFTKDFLENYLNITK